MPYIASESEARESGPFRGYPHTLRVIGGGVGRIITLRLHKWTNWLSSDFTGNGIAIQNVLDILAWFVIIAGLNHQFYGNEYEIASFLRGHQRRIHHCYCKRHTVHTLNFKMAAAKPEMQISQLVHTIARRL